MHKRLQMFSKARGFTLIELLGGYRHHRYFGFYRARSAR
jgi:hypothetical protein